ncbi:hypothetical protein BJX61DRAFT_542586 [Aspergillus egyptiacus]|nr:hypothetical protein BJX61DRAFT_542586 [Aspergillus egyptiacus]
MNLVSSPTHKYGALEIQDHENSHCAMEEMNPDSFPVWPPKTRRVWSNIFKICYNQDPNLDDGGYASILENCIALAEVGEEMEASIFVLQAIRTTLLGFDQQLYRLISEDPVSWVKLAVRIQSAPIFQESMVHLVGKWGLLEDQDRDSLPKSIKDLCNKKLEDLELTKKAVELKIVNLPRPRSDKHRQRGRNVIFAWMALNFYQQWLCESFVEGRNYRAPDGGASFYRAIAAGGDAYFDKLYHEISEFPSVEGQPESMKGLQEFENDLNELKKGIKEFVSDLLVNRAKYDPDSLGELPYLTCCKVEENEMPRPQKPETHGIDWKIDQGTQGMAMGNISAVSSQGNILPSEHMMMDFSNNATAFIINPELQISPEFSFDDFNAFNHQTTLDWDSTMPFSNAISTVIASSTD